MLAQSCKFWVYCCFIGLTRSPRGLHPSMCASDFWTCPQTPPCLTQFAQKGCQSTGLELRTLLIYSKFVVVPRKFSGGGVQNTLIPPLSERTHTNSSQQEDSEFVFYWDSHVTSKSYAFCSLLGAVRVFVRSLCQVSARGVAWVCLGRPV